MCGSCLIGWTKCDIAVLIQPSRSQDMSFSDNTKILQLFTLGATKVVTQLSVLLFVHVLIMNSIYQLLIATFPLRVALLDNNTNLKSIK